ncbi:MAG: hypothetical protein IAF38_20785, partial [Bacteroidia bacterium]|nr:hypothetical protein [Bacteroidia bacterium]
MKTDTIADLRKAIILSEEKIFLALLEEIVLKNNAQAKFISGLHDALLFAIAFASSASVKTAAEKKLKQIGEIIILRENDFQDTGISGSVVISSFTFSLLLWMTEKYQEKITFHSFDKAEEDIGESLKLILPTAEAEILSNGWNKNKLFKELCGGKISVGKIIGLFSNCKNLKLRDFVFSQLGLYVTVHFAVEVISRSSARSISYPDFFHPEILKKAEVEKIISSALSKQKKISKQEQEQLVFNSRMQLAAMGRETDPVTFASVSETEFIVLDRGFS